MVKSVIKTVKTAEKISRSLVNYYTHPSIKRVVRPKKIK